MSRTLELEASCKVAVCPEHSYHILPHGNGLVCLRVSCEVKAMASPAKEDIDAVRSPEKAHILSVVAANKRNDDNFCLFALEVVNSRNSHTV